MTRRLLAATLTLSVTTAGLAQSPTPRPLVRSVEVSVTNVDVIVTDSKGKHVTGLTRDDFLLKEDGVEQPLTNFYSVDEGLSKVTVAGAPAEETVPVGEAKVRLSVFIDNRNLTPLHRGQVLDAVGQFLEKNVGGRVEGAVTTWDRRILPRGPFTSDGKALRSIIKKLEEEPPFGAQAQSDRDLVIRQVDQALRLPPTDRTRDMVIRSAINSVRSYATERASVVEQTLGALGVAVNQMSGMEGRKILLYVCEQIPRVAGAELIQYLRESLGFNPVYQRDLPNDAEYNREDRFREVVEKAHAAGVALYPFDAKGLSADTTLTADRAGSDGRLNSGLEELNNQTMLRYMAEQTGGAAVVSRNSFDAALDEVGRDFTSYYSLGYESKARVGKPRKVVVTVKRAGLSVRSRTGHVEKSAEARLADSVVSHLWFPKTLNPLTARLNTGQPKKEGKEYVLPLTFFVPFEKITLLPEGERYRGQLVLAVAALDEAGRISPVKTQVAPIQLTLKQKEESAGKDFVFETKVEMRPVNQVMSLALTDEPSRLTSYVQIPLNVARPTK